MKKPWQSMTTAPRDGSWVLLAEDAKLTGGRGVRYVASIWVADKREPKGGKWIDGTLTQVVPLGWMSIPPFGRPTYRSKP